MNRAVLTGGLMLIALIILGCSGSGVPTQPPLTDNELTHPAAVSLNSQVLWGVWNISINPDSLEAELTPLRGAEFTCNVTQFLQPPISPVHMIGLTVLPSSDVAAGYFEVEVTIRHPFPGLPYYSGFDVRGILLSNGSYQADHDSSLVFPGEGDTRLVNADGWTRWWNAEEFTSYESIFGYTRGKLAPPLFPTSTLNGYKYFADTLDSDGLLADLDPATRGNFSNDGINSRQYNIQFKMQDEEVVFDFNYAVCASWEEPDMGFEPDFPIEAFTLSANQQEAYWMDAGFDGTTAWYENETSSGGDLHVDLEIGDWGALADDSTVEDQVSAIWVESQDFGFSPVDVLPSCTIADGNGVTTSVFSFDITDCMPSGTDDQWVLIEVHSSDPTTYIPQLEQGDLFDYPDGPLAAYMFFEAPVGDLVPTDPPVVTEIHPDSCNLDTGGLAVQVTGENFETDAQVKIVRNDDPLVEVEATDEVVDPTGTIIDCVISMDSVDGAEVGLYHVVVTNPGPPSQSGQLDDAFTIGEPSDCDTVYRNRIYECTLNSWYTGTSTYDVAFSRDGLLLGKASSGGYHLYGWDVSQNGNVNGSPVISNMLYGNYGLVKLDACDYTGNIVYQTSNNANSFVTYTEDGTLIGEITNVGTSYMQCMDTDDDGGIWTIGYTGNQVKINHYTWDGSSYNHDAVGSVNATEMNPVYNYTFDCAVSYNEDMLLIINQGSYPWKGQIYAYDISSGTPVFSYVVNNIFDETIGAHAYSHWRHAVDIEIDHSAPCLEYCRVVAMARLQPWGEGTRFVKLDTDGNKLDSYKLPDGYPLHDYYSIAIQPDPDDPDGAFLTCNREHFFGSVVTDMDTYEVPTGW